MKREAVGNTKMKALCRRLEIPQWQGGGPLESIWYLTGREAPAGEIGTVSNEDIALAIDYRGDETELLDALVALGWLDSDPVERLVVHDWADHADDVSDATNQLTGERIRQKRRKYTLLAPGDGEEKSFSVVEESTSERRSAPIPPNCEVNDECCCCA